jgi:plastocyanin
MSTYKYQPDYLFKRVLLIALLLISPALANAQTTHEVQVLDPRRFEPNDLTIEVGDTVKWVNASGGANHDVRADDGSFQSPTSSSFEFSMTFNSIEEILYHCSVHSCPAPCSAQNGIVRVVETMASAEVSVDSFSVADGIYATGDEVSVNAVLQNNGDAGSGSFNIDFYASSDTDITTGDSLIGTSNIANIGAGASLNVDEIVSLPESLPSGDYFIGAIIDLVDADSGNDSNVDATEVFIFAEFVINAGLNDAWFNPITDGQGFFITVFPDLGLVSMAWFTYDTELPPDEATANLGDPGHRWLTALGTVDGDMSEMGVSIASGGLFDTATEIDRMDDGTIVLQFSNCNEGTATYDIPSIDAQGVVPIERIALDNKGLCEALLKEALQ